jgi:hypothetical protein
MVSTRQEEVSSCKGQIGESARGICVFQIYISYSVICLEHIVDDISYVWDFPISYHVDYISCIPSKNIEYATYMPFIELI